MNLSELQRKVNGKKDKANNFAGFNYRNVEAILAQVKPLLPKGAFFSFSDEIVEVAGHPFLVATASLTFADGETHKATSAAMHALTKKGMDPAQITGSCSTYARKYALQGLLAIDDGSVDPDAVEGGYEPDEPDDPAPRGTNHDDGIDRMIAGFKKATTQKQLKAFRQRKEVVDAYKNASKPRQLQADRAYNDKWNSLPGDPALQDSAA